MSALREDSSPVVAVLYAVGGGRFTVRLHPDSPREPGRRYGEALGADGEPIGSAHQATYGVRGWTVWTRPFAGFVPAANVEVIA